MCNTTRFCGHGIHWKLTKYFLEIKGVNDKTFSKIMKKYLKDKHCLILVLLLEIGENIF